MLTTEARARLQALNTDHHRRMGQEHRKRAGNGANTAIVQKDAVSRTNLLRAMLGCEQRCEQRRDEARTVLELGASFGGERDVLLKTLSADEYVGIEIVESAAKSAADRGVHHVAIEDMPEQWTGRFQFIYSRHVMEHVVDLDEALRNLKRVLAPNGVIGAVTPHYFPDPEPAHVTQLRDIQWVAAYTRHGLRPAYVMLENNVCDECHLVAIHSEWPWPPAR